MKLVLFFLFQFMLSAVYASEFSSTNIQFLNGNNYKLGNKERTIMTLSHVSSWSHGENFLFFDVTNPFNGSTSVYGELTPSVNASKVFNKDFSEGFISDYRLTGTLEVGANYKAHLYGLGLNLEIPYFKIFKIDFLYRDTKNVDDSTYQVTLIWNLKFQVLSNDFVFTGFSDFAGKEGTREANQLYAPQLLMDMGSYWGRHGESYLGFEYQQWNNKYGVSGADEAVLQVMVKFIL